MDDVVSRKNRAPNASFEAEVQSVDERSLAGCTEAAELPIGHVLARDRGHFGRVQERRAGRGSRGCPVDAALLRLRLLEGHREGRGRGGGRLEARAEGRARRRRVFASRYLRAFLGANKHVHSTRAGSRLTALRCTVPPPYALAARGGSIALVIQSAGTAQPAAARQTRPLRNPPAAAA